MISLFMAGFTVVFFGALDYEVTRVLESHHRDDCLLS